MAGQRNARQEAVSGVMFPDEQKQSMNFPSLYVPGLPFCSSSTWIKIGDFFWRKLPESSSLVKFSLSSLWNDTEEKPQMCFWWLLCDGAVPMAASAKVLLRLESLFLGSPWQKFSSGAGVCISKHKMCNSKIYRPQWATCLLLPRDAGRQARVLSLCRPFLSPILSSLLLKWG